MAILNPVGAYKFLVFLFNSKPVASDTLAAASALNSVAQAIFFGFTDVSGIASELETEEYREGGNNRAALKFPKRGQYQNLVLKRGVTFNTALWDWHDQVSGARSKPIRKDGLILVNDRPPAGVSLPLLGDIFPVAAWYFRNGLPAKLAGPSLNAKSNEIAVESVEIVHEGLARVPLSTIPGLAGALASLAVGS